MKINLQQDDMLIEELQKHNEVALEQQRFASQQAFISGGEEDLTMAAEKLPSFARPKSSQQFNH